MNDEMIAILDFLENSYTGAKMSDDIEAMVRIARSIEAFKLDVDKDVIIENK